MTGVEGVEGSTLGCSGMHLPSPPTGTRRPTSRQRRQGQRRRRRDRQRRRCHHGAVAGRGDAAAAEILPPWRRGRRGVAAPAAGHGGAG